MNEDFSRLACEMRMRFSFLSNLAPGIASGRSEPTRRIPDPAAGVARLGYRCAPMSPEPAPPRLRRAYFECRYGQLHVHNAIPAGGGFDELTTLVCLHASSNTGRVFLELSRILGRQPLDLQPGHPGLRRIRCAAPGSRRSRGYCRGHRRLPRFHALPPGRLVRRAFRRRGGRGAGHRRPKQVRRVVMVGAPALDADAAAQLPRPVAAPEGTPRGALWARTAVFDWDADQRLPLLKQPLLVLRPGTTSGRPAPASRGWCRARKVIDLPEHDRQPAREGAGAGGPARHSLPRLRPQGPGSGGQASAESRSTNGAVSSESRSFCRPSASKFSGSSQRR